MTEPARKRATYQDILDAPRTKVAEIINGVLYVSPRPALPHATVSMSLSSELVNPFQRGRGGPGGWVFMFEPELAIGEDTLVPDLAGWRSERLPVVADVPSIDLPPDWLCEVASPSTEKLDRTEKLAIYAGHGVKHVWLVSARRRSLEVFRLQGEHWLLVGVHRDEAKIHAEPFEAVELDLGVLWANLGPARPFRASEPGAPYAVADDGA